jgi:DNA-binding NarL/FixJ family response regulator
MMEEEVSATFETDTAAAALRSTGPEPFEANAPQTRTDLGEDLGWIIRQYKNRLGAAGVFVATSYADERPAEIEAEELGPELAQTKLALIRRLDERDAGYDRGPAWQTQVTDQGPLSISTVIADDGGKRMSITALFEANEPVDRTAVELQALRMQPVLVGYFKLWLLQRSTSRRLAAVSAALCQADFGVVILDADTRIIFENSTASRILEEGRALRRCRGSLCAAKASESVRLRIAIDEAVSARGAGRPASVLYAQRPGAGAPLIAVVTSVRQGKEEGSAPVALVHIFDPAAANAAIRPICDWYELTPMEVRLVTLLTQGSSVPAMAAQVGIKEDTVRTYLKNIFRKTKTKSQADLVRFMLSNSVRLRCAGAKEGSENYFPPRREAQIRKNIQ